MKIFIRPEFRVEDKGNGGGIRRVVEAQIKYLPEFIPDLQFTRDLHDADVLALHGGDYYKADYGQFFASHCHGLYWDEYSWNKWEYELNQKVISCLQQADAITAPSEWVANIIRRALWRPVQVVPNGIDTSLWVPGDSNMGYVLWNKSRIDPICEIDSLVNLARADQAHQYVSTLGPEKNVPNNLKVVGLQPYGDATQVLVQNAGAYLCTTRETFGIGALEALSCGVPVVGWYWGGQREFVKHKVHGWLCAPGDIEGLRQGVDWCLEHRDALSGQCRELAQQYEWPQVIQQYADIYTGANRTRNSPVRVSVIIPSFNLGRYLSESVTSALNQKCDGDYEVIIVDDCSTDGSYELAMQFNKDRRVRVLQTPTNQYLAGALNYGISQARGEYILCLDADNILPPGTLNVLSTILDTNRDLDIVYGRVQFITEDGSIDKAISPDGISTWPPIDFDPKGQLSHKNQIPSTCLYRKRVWSDIGGYRKRCRTAEDADFWCRATLAGFTAKRVSNMVTLTYRNRAEGMSQVNPDWPWENWYSSYVNKLPTAFSKRISTNEPVQVSVVIPVGPHHTELYKDALDSVYNQTFKNWECIIVNDSGADLPWVPAWAKMVDNKGPNGAADARNKGLAASNTQLFVPLDADDFLTTNALEVLYKAWQDKGGYVYSDYVAAPENRRVSVGPDACANIARVMPHPLTGLYPMQAWRECGGFNSLLKVGEDWDFVANCTAQGYCGTYVAQPLVYYRVKEGGNRDAMIGNHEELYRQIQLKYGDDDMACGCRKGGGGTVQPAPSVLAGGASAAVAEQPNNSNLVLIEVIAQDMFNQRFLGRGTGNMYTFSSSGVRSKQYVDRRDADYFINNLSHQFRVANSGN